MAKPKPPTCTHCKKSMKQVGVYTHHFWRWYAFMCPSRANEAVEFRRETLK